MPAAPQRMAWTARAPLADALAVGTPSEGVGVSPPVTDASEPPHAESASARQATAVAGRGGGDRRVITTTVVASTPGGFTAPGPLGRVARCRRELGDAINAVDALWGLAD